MPPGICLNGYRSIQRPGDSRLTKKASSTPWICREQTCGHPFMCRQTALNLCPCPFCRGRSFQSIQAMAPRRDKLQLLREHNWLAIENVVADLYANGDTIPNLEKELRIRCRNQRRVDSLVQILSVVDALKDCDIALLQTLLTPTPTNRKRSRSIRRQTCLA